MWGEEEGGGKRREKESRERVRDEVREGRKRVGRGEGLVKER